MGFLTNHESAGYAAVRESSNNQQPKKMSNLIIPDELKEKLVPIEFPLKPLGDTVIDANDKEVASINDKIDIRQSINIAKLFAASYTMFELVRDYYALTIVLAASNSLPHGTPDETDEEKAECLLCKSEALLARLS